MALTLIGLLYAYDSILNNAIVTDCKIDISKLLENAPLLLNTGTGDILYPPYGSSTITLQHDDQIELACPGGSGIQEGILLVVTGELATARCRCGELKVHERVVDINAIQCAKRITSVARYTEHMCWGVGLEIEVGLNIENGRWLRVMTACFDNIKKNVLYVHYILTKFIGKQTTRKLNVGWTEDNFYKLSSRLNDIYPLKEHRKIINRQVGLPEDDSTYVRENGQYYISKGHLGAKADFMYSPLQLQTYHYINSAPQWMNFNAKNWFNFEKNLRQYTANRGVDLEIYTGTFNITTLRHQQSGEEVEIYLHVDEYGYKKMPIPKIFWKIAYDPTTRAGIVVLGVNNPYDVIGGIICNDVASRLNWLHLDRFNMAKGYVYACSIAEFSRFIPYLPRHLITTNILN